MNRVLLNIIFIGVVLVLAGCQGEQQIVFRDDVIPKIEWHERQTFSAGKSVQGRDIEFTVHGDGADVIMIIAGIHGNERAGVPLVKKLDSFLSEKPYKVFGRTIILAPIVNPDGYAANSRFNANKIDINRNFQTSNRVNNNRNGLSGFSEPEAIALAEVIQKYRPERIVSIHSPLGCVDYDGDAFLLAYRMGKASGLKVKRLGSRPGSLGSYAGVDIGVPIITLECTKKDDGLSSEELWGKYGQTLLTAIEYQPSFRPNIRYAK
jgi:murein peptide amidase A